LDFQDTLSSCSGLAHSGIDRRTNHHDCDSRRAPHSCTRCAARMSESHAGTAFKYFFSAVFFITQKVEILIDAGDQGFSKETIKVLKKVFRLLFHRIPGIGLAQAMEQVERDYAQFPEVSHMLEFIRGSERGICRKS